jgi:hypothetical protein
MKRIRQKNQGSIMTLAIIGAGIGMLVVGSLVNMAIQDFYSTEKEIGHAKSNQSLKLSNLIYNESVRNSANPLTKEQKRDLSHLIGGEGSSSNNTIFGQKSVIPGFNQFGVVWDGLGAGKPSKITSTHKKNPNSIDAPNAFREGSKAVLSVKDATSSSVQDVDFFDRLVFYNGDWEILPLNKKTHTWGGIYSNGNIYMDSAPVGLSVSMVRFNSLAITGNTILTTPKKVFRRGRSGQTSWYHSPNPGNIMSSYNFHIGGNNNGNEGLSFIFLRKKNILTSNFTNFEDELSTPSEDTTKERELRRFAGGEGGEEKVGYVYTGVDYINHSIKFDDRPTPVIKFGNPKEDTLSNFSKNMDPYQLIEDIQSYNTPDIITHQAQNGQYKNKKGDPLPTNYGNPNSNVLKENAMNAIAALVIRDGVAYYRTEPNGALIKVLGNAGVEGLYPDDTFSGAKTYGDLRWYGHFGQGNPLILATPSNPDRWHFPIRSVTFNKTIDTLNTGASGTSSTEGTAVGFTFRAAKHDPVTDGTSGPATWIRRDIDLSGITGYPNQAAMTVVSNPAATSDPVRTAYNAVKAEVRKLYNAHHIYTSRHNGAVMLNRDGTTPVAVAPAIPRPNVWGANPPPIDPVNYDTPPTNKITTTTVRENAIPNDYSAFWNDDGARIINAGAIQDRPYTFTNANGIAKDGILTPDLNRIDNTPRVELFPIRHASLDRSLVVWPSSNPAAGSLNHQTMNNWYIYKSTLPFSDRTLRMPLGIFSSNNTNANGGFTQDFIGADYLNGLDYVDRNNGIGIAYLDNQGARPENNGQAIYARWENFGYAGATQVNGRFPPTGNGAQEYYNNKVIGNQNFHNCYTLLNNAPEMLARIKKGGDNQKTFEMDFAYNASDTGGYYGINNLCMIDHQEKKIVVFTEIDLAELTKECFLFNGLPSFEGTTNTIRTGTGLQKVIYVVNTTMGNNFFGKRVHCGAVRIVRGHMLAHPLTIATPNALHVWGDFNCPGYLHQFTGDSSIRSFNKNHNAVSYEVPEYKEHTPKTSEFKYASQPAALYADTIHTYGNNWIPFNQIQQNFPTNIYDEEGGHLNAGWYALWGPSEDIIFMDTQLWWEDDGLRNAVLSVKVVPEDLEYGAPGAQRFLNYHALIFNEASNYYNQYIDISKRQTIFKQLEQGIYAGLVYGNVESRLPSTFASSDVSAIPITKPNDSLKQLDWMMSWIPRTQWIEMKREQMINLDAGTFKIPTGQNLYDEGALLTLSNYYGANFPKSNATPTSQFEKCKTKFSGGGFLKDIRSHNSEGFYNISDDGVFRTISGSFVCLFNSRQSTHGWNPTIVGAKNPHQNYSYDSRLGAKETAPPGTPETGEGTSISEPTKYFIEGTRWDY